MRTVLTAGATGAVVAVAAAGAADVAAGAGTAAGAWWLGYLYRPRQPPGCPVAATVKKRRRDNLLDMGKNLL